MMWLALVLTLASNPAAGASKKLPPAGETAKLYFLAGDLAKAVEWATRGLKTDAKVCKPMLKALAEYGFLAHHTDEFTPAQARDFIKYDRAISPAAPGKLTQPIIERFVSGPLARALQTSDKAEAKDLVERVLFVDAKNPEALSLQKIVSKP